MNNQAYSDQLVAEAAEASRRAARHRRALLTAAMALGTTGSLQAARKVLDEWDGPAEIRDDALAVIDGLAIGAAA